MSIVEILKVSNKVIFLLKKKEEEKHNHTLKSEFLYLN